MAKGKADDVLFPDSGPYQGPTYDFYVPHRVVDTGPFPPSLARQEFAEECDINVIMQRYEKTGVITHVTPREPKYYDLTAQPGDLRELMQTMQDAEEAFMRLPAKIRREFDNDPVSFVDFASDKANLDQMREWGLAAPKPEQALKPAEPASVPAGSAASSSSSGKSEAPKAPPTQ